MQHRPSRLKHTLLRTAQMLTAGAALALITACGGDDNNGQPPSGMKMQIVSFGDSLSDVGTYTPMLRIGVGGGLFTTNPGEIWTQKVAEYYGDKLTPANLGGFSVPLHPAGGLGYAQGGARVTLQPGIGYAADGSQATTMPIADQVQQYLSEHTRFNAQQIVLINGGANDIFVQVQAAQAEGLTISALIGAASEIQQAAQDLATLTKKVFDNGATHVFVANVPDIGQTPLALTSGSPAMLTMLAQMFNQALSESLQTLGIDTNAVIIDTFTWQNDVTQNYQAYGFSVSNTGTACNLKAMTDAAAASGQPMPLNFGSSLFCSPQTYTVANADKTYMYADLVHPTSGLYAHFANYAEKQIQAQLHPSNPGSK